jgi:hypothetical protein
VLHDTGLAAPPQEFTELFFTNPNRLPSVATRPGGRLPVRFAIRNREAALRTYAWSASASGQRSGRGFDSGRVVVRPGRSVRIVTRLRPDCSTRRTNVVVRLRQPARRLAFGYTCSVAAIQQARGTPVDVKGYSGRPREQPAPAPRRRPAPGG